jgi:oligoendopeptidase F
LDWWDRNAPLPQTSDKTIKWLDAKSIILDSFSSFHPKFLIWQNYFSKIIG